MSDEKPETGPWRPVKFTPHLFWQAVTWQCSDLVHTWGSVFEAMKHLPNYCHKRHKTEEAAVKHCAALNRGKEKGTK